MAHSGFIVLPRDLVESDLWKCLEPTHRTVFLTVLVKANWKDGEWYNWLQEVTVRRGQLVTSQEKLASLCGRGISRTVVRRALKRLVKARLIDLEENQPFTFITVMDYDRYGLATYLKNQKEDQLGDASRPRGDPEATPERPTIESIKAVEALEQEGINTYTCAEEFHEYWNSHHSLPRIKKMTEGRIRALTRTLEDHDFRAGWKEAVEKLSESHFHTGGGESGWVADVDWFLKEGNWLKCLELASVSSLEETGEEQARLAKEQTRRLLEELEDHRKQVDEEREHVNDLEGED